MENKKFNECQTFIFTSNTSTLTKRLDVLLTYWNSMANLNYNLQGVKNIDHLDILFWSQQTFSFISRSFCKMNTNNLQILQLNHITITLKDFIRIIHKWDKLVEFITRWCKIDLNCKEVRINENARFWLHHITFAWTSIDFELDYLVKILIQNESLRKRLKISFKHRKFGERNVTLAEMTV